MYQRDESASIRSKALLEGAAVKKCRKRDYWTDLSMTPETDQSRLLGVEQAS